MRGAAHEGVYRFSTEVVLDTCAGPTCIQGCGCRRIITLVWGSPLAEGSREHADRGPAQSGKGGRGVGAVLGPASLRGCSQAHVNTRGAGQSLVRSPRSGQTRTPNISPSFTGMSLPSRPSTTGGGGANTRAWGPSNTDGRGCTPLPLRHPLPTHRGPHPDGHAHDPGAAKGQAQEQHEGSEARVHSSALTRTDALDLHVFSLSVNREGGWVEDG